MSTKTSFSKKGLIAALVIFSGSLGFATTPEPPSPDGFPRPMTFRNATPEMLDASALTWIRMVVSDILTDDRRGVEAAFKKMYPERPVLVQHDGALAGAWQFVPQQFLEDWGVFPVTMDMVRRARRLKGFADGVHPAADFPGYWLYDAGSDSLSAISANQRTVTFKVKDATPFRPNTHNRTVRDLDKVMGLAAYHKNVVICPRDAQGALDWSRAGLALITALDEAAGMLTVERLGRQDAWTHVAPGAYVAPDSSLMFSANPLSRTALTPRLSEARVLRLPHPNLTRFCPRDPRTGLNAAEYFAKHYIDMKRTLYPTCDGLVFDVSIGMFYPSTRVSAHVDCDLDGQADNFFVGRVNHWALGMYDVLHAIRHGVPGKFDGLGEDVVLVADVNGNDDQRFFDIMNGAEFEHAMQWPVAPAGQRFSSSLDALLIWSQRGRKPDMSFVHNKYPDETHHGGDRALLRPPMTLSWYRLNMAAACMGSGYVGKEVSRTAYGAPETLIEYPERSAQKRKYGGFAPPPDYDEYHAGNRQIRGWLGRPIAAPRRLTRHLGEPIWRLTDTTPIPRVVATHKDYRAAPPARVTNQAVRFTIESTGLWRSEKDFFKLKSVFPLHAAPLRAHNEYGVCLWASGSGPFAEMEPHYHAIPRNVAVRLSVRDADGKITTGPHQEFLVFDEARPVSITLTAPANGDGVLEFCLGEAPGFVELRHIEMFPQSVDAMARLFENGLVLLNGSITTTIRIDLDEIAPGTSWSRLQGTQDPQYNNGALVNRYVNLPPLDGLFLIRAAMP